MGATARMQHRDLRVNHSFSDFEDPAGRIGVLYGNEVCSASARHGAAKQSLQLCVCGWNFRNELTSSRSLRASALMSTSDAKRLSGSPVLRSPEQEIALSAVICTYNRYDLLSSTTRRIKLVPRDSDSAIQACPISPTLSNRSRDFPMPTTKARRRHLAASSPSSMTTHALPLPGPKNCSTLMPHLTAERGSWVARLCRVGQT
jgi:hypothetical protein